MRWVLAVLALAGQRDAWGAPAPALYGAEAGNASFSSSPAQGLLSSSEEVAALGLPQHRFVAAHRLAVAVTDVCHAYYDRVEGITLEHAARRRRTSSEASPASSSASSTAEPTTNGASPSSARNATSSSNDGLNEAPQGGDAKEEDDAAAAAAVARAFDDAERRVRRLVRLHFGTARHMAHVQLLLRSAPGGTAGAAAGARAPRDIVTSHFMKQSCTAVRHPPPRLAD